MYPRRILLNKAYNTRELGGYATLNGKQTKYKRFLRADNVSLCEPEDVETLVKYGLKTVIDLRSAEELTIHPNVFTNVSGISFHNIPLMSNDEQDDSMNFDFTKTDTLIPLYIAMLKNKSKMSKLFQTLADSCDGVTLFHCTAGKDRTGITAMLLLMLADVPKLDIIADYQVTFTLLLPLVGRLREKYPQMPQHVMQSEPEWIETAFNFIVDNYKDAQSYLKFLGLSDSQLKRLNAKLTD